MRWYFWLFYPFGSILARRNWEGVVVQRQACAHIGLASVQSSIYDRSKTKSTAGIFLLDALNIIRRYCALCKRRLSPVKKYIDSPLRTSHTPKAVLANGGARCRRAKACYTGPQKSNLIDDRKEILHNRGQSSKMKRMSTLQSIRYRKRMT